MYKIVNIYGDSHCRIFFRDKLKIQKDGICINNKYLSKVSLKGLCNNNSKLNMNNRILNDNDHFSNTINDVLICLKFGQVDLEYVYYYKKYVKKENINIEGFTDKLINIYLNFIKKMNNKNILIISTSLPNPNTYLKAIQKSIGMSIQVDYTELLKHFHLFNEKLKKMASINKIFFL